MKNKIDISLILSGVRALLGHVPSALRQVSVEVNDDTIYWKCVFDSNANEKDIELLSQASAELISDYSNYKLKEIYEVIEYPTKGSSLKNLIYYRHEHNYYED